MYASNGMYGTNGRTSPLSMIREGSRVEIVGEVAPYRGMTGVVRMLRRMHALDSADVFVEDVGVVQSFYVVELALIGSH